MTQIPLNLPCPCCGRPYPTLFVTGTVRQTLVDLVAKRSPFGILSTEIADVLYGVDPNGGPTSGLAAIHALVHHANKQLRPQGYEIFPTWKGRGARYALRPFNANSKYKPARNKNAAGVERPQPAGKTRVD